jgi:hypothetical protein
MTNTQATRDWLSIALEVVLVGIIIINAWFYAVSW